MAGKNKRVKRTNTSVSCFRELMNESFYLIIYDSDIFNAYCTQEYHNILIIDIRVSFIGSFGEPPIAATNNLAFVKLVSAFRYIFLLSREFKVETLVGVFTFVYRLLMSDSSEVYLQKLETRKDCIKHALQTAQSYFLQGRVPWPCCFAEFPPEM